MTYRCDLYEKRLKELRNQINEDDFVYTNYKNQGKDYTWHLICATLDRLDDTVKYLNSLEIDWDADEFAVFKFYELLNYTCQIRDMVYDLAKLFSVSLYDIKKTKDIFGNIGNETASDDKYVEYLRSLCAIHPTKTDRHNGYGYQTSKEYCPYIGKGGRFNKLLGHDKNEILITVYQNDEEELDKFIFIKLNDIYKYLYQRYEKIDLISKRLHETRTGKNTL